MARPSQISLASLRHGPKPRMEPPKRLRKAQAEMWKAIVATKPPDWFTADNEALLVEYIRAVEACDKTAKLVDRAFRADDTEELKDATQVRDREAKRATTLATKLRLTNQSRYTENAAATASKNTGNDQGKPWQKRA